MGKLTLKKRLWAWITKTDARTHIAHTALVLVGSALPSVLAYWAWGSLMLAAIVGNIFAEVWLLFMGSREVADYIRRKFKAVIAEDMDKTWLDGLGDLAGPIGNRLFWWTFLITIIFK